MSAHPAQAARALAARIEARTPASRDRTVDALRALAIVGVILGHWLVTALVPAGGGLYDRSPLAAMPALAPVSWLFQTLAVFFFVGGYAAARSLASARRGGRASRGYWAWLGQRMARLGRPVAVLAAVWVPVTAGMALAGVPMGTIHTVAFLVLSPLWFLCVFAGLTALTPLAAALVRRCGALAAVFPAAAVAGVDAARFALGGPGWLGWINVGAGWLVPYLLGMAWARGAFHGWRVPAALLAGGVAATLALVTWAGYPASMVGVNGAHISNLNPPTLAAVTFGVAQVGLALLLRPVLGRLMRRPLAWAAVALANLSAMTLFLWHQSAFLLVNLAGSAFGRLPGLLTAPSTGLWVAQRLAWLPVFAATLAVVWLLLYRFERPRRRASRRPARPWRPAPGSKPADGGITPRDRQAAEVRSAVPSRPAADSPSAVPSRLAAGACSAAQGTRPPILDPPPNPPPRPKWVMLR